MNSMVAPTFHYDINMKINNYVKKLLKFEGFSYNLKYYFPLKPLKSSGALWQQMQYIASMIS